MDKQNAQMNASHPGTNSPAEYPPQNPPAAFQGPPGHTGYPGPQAAFSGTQTGYPGHLGAYPGTQVGYLGTQTGYSVPPPSYAGAGPVGFLVQHQPMYHHPGGPAGVPWMPAPPPPSDCPPGLEYLSQIDQILIHQQVELLEVLIGFETNNRYEIKNSLGQRIYFAAEDTDCCTRNCCGASRPFTMRILDNMGREVMTLERPLRCTSCCCPCCLQEIEIHAPPGVPIGYVTQNWHPCLPKFTVQNERREDVLKIVGPCLVCSCCADIDFEIKSIDEENVVGKISKQWTGFVREAFTDADNFGIQFPIDLDVKMKAVMLGACFLIDFMFFETSGGKEQRTGVWQ
ncbi:phospholipid scramblase 2 isoform X1 [Pteropus alecto]|uniref:Phospholipid scramblase n=2 Tax=Pteropus alecto TaxID=9402 RepID=L5K8N6_PTEAL|nr:phospholipid scramblase 2 isoform X1 [Pteropus alecto]XP_015449124.1 phospholipid scramblase 2 isoform X1 [Pteropus alecto]XP_024906515.1 phospholipid scramblase 2 isoform X1 [Pteropus alecto]ELK07732.1 Phospholipid scramblase 2 [Pteropus alecto]